MVARSWSLCARHVSPEPSTLALGYCFLTLSALVRLVAGVPSVTVPHLTFVGPQVPAVDCPPEDDADAVRRSSSREAIAASALSLVPRKPICQPASHIGRWTTTYEIRELLREQPSPMVQLCLT
jgi:hypothetical protein